MDKAGNPQAGLNLLLVDWDLRARGYAARELSSAGHVVFEAGNGREAWFLGETLSRPLHLLVTDVFLTPGCNGFDLARLMQGMRPGLPVLYLCDIPSDETVRRDLESSLEAFLSKPFDGARLRAKVQALARGPVRRRPRPERASDRLPRADPGMRLAS